MNNKCTTEIDDALEQKEVENNTNEKVNAIESSKLNVQNKSEKRQTKRKRVSNESKVTQERLNKNISALSEKIGKQTKEKSHKKRKRKERIPFDISDRKTKPVGRKRSDCEGCEDKIDNKEDCIRHKKVNSDGVEVLKEFHLKKSCLNTMNEQKKQLLLKRKWQNKRVQSLIDKWSQDSQN